MAEVLHWYPPVGVFIGILGLLGVVVPLVRDLAKMGKWEKAGWTLVMFALMGLELRSIYIDRRDHEGQQAAARAELLDNFQRIADGIKTEITTSQSEFAATMKRSDAILGGVGESLNVQSGGDSYAYARVSPGDGFIELYIIQVGDHHLRNVSGFLLDMDKLHTAFLTGQEMDSKLYQINVDRMPVLRRQQVLFVGKFPWPGDSDYRQFNVALSADNGTFSTMLRLKHVSGRTWTSALVVGASYYDGKGGIVCTRMEKEFPPELVANDLNWTQAWAAPKFSVKDGGTCAK
jgi:hypothetical protein